MITQQLIDALKIKKSFKIVFLGDSITSAEWVHPNWREIVEYVLKEELSKQFSDWKIPSWGLRCINSGFDGSTTQDWLSRLQADVLDYHPDMVIVMGTINDKDLGLSADESQNNLKQILSKLSQNIPLIIYSTDIASSNDDYNQEYEVYIQKTKELFPFLGATFINLFEQFSKLNRSRLFTFKSVGNEVVGIKPGDLDFLHPNQLGNAYIAQIILDQVFSISFDSEKYISKNNLGQMFPGYQ